MHYTGLHSILSYIEDACGIHFGLEKEEFLHSRLEGLMKSRGHNNYHELLEEARKDIHGRLKREIIDAITINETYFFRDKDPFTLCIDEILPKLAHRKQALKENNIEILCAGCSTGQEPYSLGISILESHFLEKVMPVHIVGGDIAGRVLSIAQKGFYSQLEVDRGLSKERINRFFTPHENGWIACPELRSLVSFVQVNLVEAVFPAQLFDVIFCRNVLIYFTEQMQIQIVNNLTRHLKPMGILIIGSTEILDTKKLPFTKCGNGAKIHYEYKGWF